MPHDQETQSQEDKPHSETRPYKRESLPSKVRNVQMTACKEPAAPSFPLTEIIFNHSYPKSFLSKYHLRRRRLHNGP